MIRSLFSAVIAALLVVGGCARSSEKPVVALPPVILISIDTLRSDHLPAYGYRGVETPHIDALRRDAVLFQRAYAPTPMTLPSHLTMLTGLLPPEHGVRDNVGFRFDASKHVHLPARLKQKGYVTGAAISSYVLRADTGMGAMFDVYDDAIDVHPGAAFREFQRAGPLTAASAISWISSTATRPFFLFFHLYEPHVPYEAPSPFRERYANAYDAEIAAADSIVGSLLEDLKKRGIYERAIIVLTSDHGEGLGEHGEEQHSIFVYRESIQVPLLIKLPGRDRANTTVADPVTLADLAPTILALTGDGQPDTRHGRALFGGDRLARPVYAESLYPRYHFGWSELRSIIDGRWHYIDAPKGELYDVIADPRETKNLADSERRQVSRFRASLQTYGADVPALQAIDPEAARRLESLGYIGRPRNPSSGPLPNPRDEIVHLDAMRKGLALAASGESERAIDAFRAILQRAPEMHEVRVQLAETLARSGRLEESLEEYRQALGRAPASPQEISLAMGELLLQMNRPDQARQYAVAGADGNAPRGRALLVRIALAERNGAEALRMALAAADAADASPADLLLLAEVQIAAGQLPEALETIVRAERRAAERRVPRVYRLEFLRGDALGRLERVPEAIAAYEKEIAAFPENTRAFSNLAILHFISGRPERSEEMLRQMVSANPGAVTRALAARTRQALRENP